MTDTHPPGERCVFCTTAERMYRPGGIDCPASQCPHWVAIQADPSVRYRLPTTIEEEKTR